MVNAQITETAMTTIKMPQTGYQGSHANPTTAKPEYTRRTSKDCSFCHVQPGDNLNDAGRYYADHQHSLKGYASPAKPKPSH